MTIATGNQSSDKAFQSFSRLRKMDIFEGDMMHSVEVEDKPGIQTLRFDPTLATDRLVLKLKAGFRGKHRRHTCITDIVFYKANRSLNGKHLGAHIKKNIRMIVVKNNFLMNMDELLVNVNKKSLFTAY